MRAFEVLPQEQRNLGISIFEFLAPPHRFETPGPGGEKVDLARRWTIDVRSVPSHLLL
jgi:hypothetical protein